MIFVERGRWIPTGRTQIGFSNTYRWTLNLAESILRLEHLRFGADQPVYLFDLMPESYGVLASMQPHVCQEDCYTARLEYDANGIRLTWTVAGTEKNETIEYYYL